MPKLSQDELRIRRRKARWKRLNKERYDFYKDNGICISCGREFSEPGRVRCRTCADKIKQYQESRRQELVEYKRILRQRRIDAGLCINCGKRPPLEGRRMCKRCNQNALDSSKKYKMKKRNEKLYGKGYNS